MITRFSKMFALAGIVLSTYFSCKDNGTNSPEEDCRPVSPTDSTSHNFIWRLDTLGEGNGSGLNDVFVINDTLAYAVGEISVKDSLGGWRNPPFNIARWNGTKWELMNVLYSYQGQQVYVQLYSVFAIAPNDIWFGGNGLIRWDGVRFSEVPIPSSVWVGTLIKKMWANSKSLYIGGSNGSAAFFDGNVWQKLNTGTTIDIQDIWGGTNCKGEVEILAVASFKQAVPQMKKLLRIDGTNVVAVSDDGLPLAVSSVWFKPRERYFIGGDGLFSNQTIGSIWNEEQNIPAYYKESVRGVGINDIMWVGGFGFVSHFNGSSWKHYTGVEVPLIQGNYHSVSIHPRVVAAVGTIVGGKAVALTGKR